jgi:hypothetical protein
MTSALGQELGQIDRPISVHLPSVAGDFPSIAMTYLALPS